MINNHIKKIAALLVICIPLSGCQSALKDACITNKKKPQKDECDQSISSKDPLTNPYKVVGSKPAEPAMAIVKEQLMAASGAPQEAAAIGALRVQALRETALSLGARGGLADRAQQINGYLTNYEPMLYKIFQFNGMLLDSNVLPPVLIEARNTLNLTGSDAIRIADRTYKIIAQARFVTATPTWREYLWMAYSTPELPDRSLLPRNKPERIMWERDIEEGWKAGMAQADLIFTENINRLVRDYTGMILYRKLLQQNMVSPPYVASLDMGVTGSGDNLTVNDRVLRITAFPELQADSNEWKTEIHVYD